MLIKFNVLLIIKLMVIVPISSWLLMIVKSFKPIVTLIVMTPTIKEVMSGEPLMDLILLVLLVTL